MTAYEVGGPDRYRHQRQALRRMIETRGVCALLMDPGTGKTAPTLDYMGLLALKSPRQEARVLVVAPLVALDTWVEQAGVYVSPMVDLWAEALGGTILQRAEALAARGGSTMRLTTEKRVRKVGPRARHVHRSLAVHARQGESLLSDVTGGPDAVGSPARPRLVIEVLNIDALSSRRAVGSKTTADIMVDAVQRFDPDLVVVDESHKIKSVSGNASRVMSRISKFVPRRVILTGTVMPHSPLDVFAQWRFLEPFAFGTRDKVATFGGFRNRYAVMGGYMGHEVVGFRNLDEMQDVMARNAIVVRKEDALDLPATTEVVIPVHLSPAEQRAYDTMKSDLAVDIGEDSTVAPNHLAQMMRLRQITAGHLPIDDEVRTLGTSKADTIASLVHDTLAGEKRIVIFALFKAEVETLRAALSRKGTEVLTITGATPNDERIAMRKRFGSDDPSRLVMVAQIKTMSLAVNELVTASHAIFASMSQQRDDWVQAKDRLNRIGQTRPTTFWYANVPGTIDDVILDVHRNRTSLENALLAHIKATS